MKKVLTLLSNILVLLFLVNAGLMADCNFGVFDAGADANVCGLTATLQAGVPYYGNGEWAGPGVFSDPNSGTTSVTVADYGAHLFSWTITNPDCPPFTDFVTVIFDPPPSEANGGADITVCGLSTAMHGFAPAIGSGVWSGTGLDFANIYDPGSLVTAPAHGNYTAVWTTSNCDCELSTDAVSLTFLASLTVDAGPDAEVCGLSHNLNASSSGSTGYWSGPGIFSDINSPSSTVTVAGQGTYVFYWNATNDCGTTSDAVTVSFTHSGNSAFAGADVTVHSLSYTLGATLPAGTTGTWSGNGNFANVNAANTVVTVPGPGTYVFTWTINDGCASSSDSVTVTFDPCTVEVNAGEDIETCGLSTYLSAQVNTSGTGTWSGSANFSNPNDPNTYVSVDTYGAYNLIWTVNDPICGFVSDNVVVVFGEAPTSANAGPDDNTCSLSYMLQAETPAVGEGHWTGPGVFSDVSDPNATVTVASPGNYSFYWTVTNCTCPPVDDYVNIYFGTETPTSQAGPAGQTCGLAYVLSANAPAAGMTGTWTGNGTFSNPTDPNTTVSVAGPGTYNFTWTVDAGVCGTASSSTYVEFTQAPQNNGAGSDMNVCGNSVVLSATAVAPGLEGYWSGPATFEDPLNPGTVATVAGPGTYTFYWTVANCCCAPVSDAVVVTFSSAGAPPHAGDDASACGYTFQLAANTPSTGTGQWTGNGVFTNASSPTSLVTVASAGNYTFNWTVSTDCGSQSDDVHVLFLGDAPAAHAGSDDNICGLTYGLNAQSPAAGIGYWTGPGVFSDPNNPASTVTVPAIGTYNFVWTTIGNSACPSNSDQVSITFTQNDPDVNAGPDASYCNQLSHVLAASAASQGVGSWTGNGSFSNVNDPNATVTVSGYGTYNFTWTVSNGTCGSASDVMQVVFAEQPTTVNAGPDGSSCSLVYNLTASNPIGGTGQWSGPGVFSNANSPNTNVQVSGPGTYTFTYTVSNSVCAPVEDYVNVTFTSAPDPAIAGPDASYCSLSATLAAVPATGGYWSVPAGISISNINDENAVITASTAGTYTLTWVTSNVCYDNSDQVVISLNQAPAVPYAGADASACGHTYQLQGTGSGTWFGDGVFSNPNDANSTVTVAAAGTYSFNWISSNDCGSASDQVEITFIDGPNPVNAGQDVSTCTLSYNLIATGGSGGNGNWTGNGTFSNAGSQSSIVTVAAPGTYTYTYTSTNNCGSTSDSVTVTFGEAPEQAQAGEDFAICGLTAQLNGILPSGTTGFWTGTTSIDSPTNAATLVTAPSPGTYTYTWTISNACASTSDAVSVTFLGSAPEVNAGTDASVCSLDYVLAASGGSGSWSGPGTFTDANSPNSAVSVAAPGIYTFTWTGDDQCGINSDEVTITFGQAPGAAQAGDDFAICGLNATINAILPANTTGSWTGSTAISNPTSSSTNVTAPGPGTYTYTWTVSNSCGSMSDAINVTFLGDAPAVNAGTDASICSLSYTLAASGGAGSWSGAGVFSDASLPNSSVTVSTPGSYTFTWTGNSQCGSSSDQVTITFGEPPAPSNAGEDFAVCGLSTNLNAVLPANGTGSWTNGQGINNPGLANSLVNVPSAGTYTYTWTNSNSCGSSSDQVNVTFLGTLTANAGPDQSVCGLNANLAALAPNTGTGSWSGPGLFANANSTITNVSVISPGTYTFYWTVSGQCGTSSDEVQVTFSNQATANAGLDMEVCGLTHNLSASGGSGFWSGNGVFANANSQNTTVTVSNYGTYDFTWTSAGGSCGDSSDSVQIIFGEQPVFVEAGPDVDVCGLSYVMSAAIPTVGEGTWVGPGLFSDPSQANATVTVPSAGTYTFTWVVENCVCPIISDQVTITFGGTAPTANAGPDQTLCSLSTALGATGSGTWSGNGVFSNPNNPNSAVSVAAAGNYTFTWTSSNECGSSSDQVSINFNNGSATANAGPDIQVCGLSGQMSGLLPSGATGTWSGTATFANPGDPNSVISVDQPGIYQVAWSVTGTCGSGVDYAVVEFGLPPTVVNAGPDGTTCGLNYNLSAAVPDIGIGTWQGPGLFGDANEPVTTVQVASPGTYTFTWTVSNCNCPLVTDEVTITFGEGGLIADAGADQDACGLSAALSAILPAGATGQWSGPGSFTDPANPNSVVQVAATGTQTFTWTVTSECGSSSDQVNINFGGSASPANAGVDQEVCGLGTSLNAVLPPGATGQWSGPGTFTDPSNPNTVVAVAAAGTSTFTWTVSSECGSSSDEVMVSFDAGSVSANAGTDQFVCGLSFALSAEQPAGTSGQWTGPGTFTDANDPNTIVQVAAGGPSMFTWTLTSDCGTSSDAVTITFGEDPELAYAGADQSTCGLVALLSGTPLMGGQWTGNGSFSNPNEGNTSVTVVAPGVYTFTYTVSNTCGTSSDEVTVTFEEGADIANAGPDQSVCSLSTVMAATGSGVWTGDGIFDSNDANATVTVTSPGTYLFTWTASDDCGTSSDQVEVVFGQSPSLADAGENMQVCGLSYTLDGNLPAIGVGTWSGAGTFSNANLANSTVTVEDYGDYTFSWEIENDCGSDMDLVIISFVEGETANAGTGGDICGLSFDLNASGSGTWTGNGNFADANSASTTVSVVAPGTYTFTWTIDGDCAVNSSANVSVTFIEDTAAANAGADSATCGEIYTLSANPAFGTWSGPGEFADANDPNTTVTVTSFGPATFVWTSSSDCGTSSDEVVINFNDPNPTTAAVGENETICGLSYQLTGNVPSVGTGTWSGAGSFSDVNDPAAIVTVPETGDYTFAWTIENECDSSMDLMIISFEEGSATADAGEDAAVCGLSHTLSATAAIGGTWSGDAGVVFTDVNNASSSVTVPAPGTYTFTWTVDSDCGQASDMVMVAFETSPAADAGADGSTCGLTYDLNAIYTTEGQSGTWSGNGIFSDANSANSSVTVVAPGTYTYTWTTSAIGDCPQSSDQVSVTFTEGIAADAGPDATTCGIFLYALEASLPEGASGMWSGAGTFANASDPNTTVAVLDPGTFTFTWTVSGTSCGDGSDEVEITYIEPLNANAGADGVNCDLDYVLNASNAPEGATGYWSAVDGLSFSAMDDPSATVTAAEAGIYTLTWNLEQEGCNSDTDQVVLDLGGSDAITADAGPDDQQCGLTFELSAQLNANATGYWTGIGEFADANSPTTMVTVGAYGVYIFTWHVASPCGTSTDQVQVEFGTQPTIVNAGPDDSVCGLSYTFQAEIPDVGLGFWLGEGEFSSTANPAATVTVPDYGTYTFVWSVENCNCPTVSDEIVITFEDCDPNNDVVTAVDDDYSTEMNTELMISPMNNDLNPGGGDLFFTAVTQPANGTVVPVDDALVYQPDEGYTGTDVFTYTVCNSEGSCDTAIVTVDIVYTPSDCEYAGAFCTEPLTPVTICILPCEVSGGFITDLTTTYNCSLSVTSDICFTYTPLPEYLGEDQIVISYCDADGNCETHYADISVGNCEGTDPDPNSTPIAQDDLGSTVSEGSITISPLSNDSDPDDDELTIAAVGDAANGTVVQDGYDLIYTPAAGFTGTDFFGYTVCDPEGACATAIVSITVVGGEGNNPPFAQEDAVSILQNEIAGVDVLTNDSDPDGDSFFISSYTQPSNGNVVQGGSTLLYTPNTDYVGTDMFTYEICDTEGNCTFGTVNVTITADVACDNPAICTEPITPTEVCANFCTIDNSDVTIQDVHTLFDCSINLLGGTCVQYTGLPAFIGEEELEITGCDSDGNCETVVVIVNVVEDCDNLEEGKSPEGESLMIPNFFSPNGDGFNDYWLVDNLPEEDDLYVRVFDLNGRMLMEEQIWGILLWDGRVGGITLNSGMYAYTLGNGKNVHYSGLLSIGR